jgi:hypothetical protein
VALVLFEDVLQMRLTPSSRAGEAAVLKPMAEKPAFLGDFKSKTFQAFTDGNAPNAPTAWLPTERVAKAWQAMVADKPFEKLEVRSQK